MAGDHSAARNVNRNILINELDLRQVSNTSIFVKERYFVLSASVQNYYNWFDLRLVILKQFDRKTQKGYLLIRFFDKFLIADLRTFLREMVSKDNYVKTKVSGVHWKFIIKVVNNRYVIVNQKDKKQFVIEEVSIEELKGKFTSHKKQITSSGIKVPEAVLHKKIDIIVENSSISLNATSNPKNNRKGLMDWFIKLFRRS